MTSVDLTPQAAPRAPRTPSAAPGAPATGIAALSGLLHETAERHDAYEKRSAPHDWWDWYAAYLTARRSGSAPDEAAERAGRYMADELGVALVP